jgi:hypothetical protein
MNAKVSASSASARKIDDLLHTKSLLTPAPFSISVSRPKCNNEVLRMLMHVATLRNQVRIEVKQPRRRRSSKKANEHRQTDAAYVNVPKYRL